MAIYCVRGNFGEYTQQFLEGGFVAIGWLEDDNLSSIKTNDYDKLTSIYKNHYRTASKMSAAQNIGQIWRFLIELKQKDTVITPGENVEDLFYGEIKSDYYFEKDSNCPYPHRKKVDWNKKPLLRTSLSIPLQNSLRSSLTVFNIKHETAFLDALGKKSADKAVLHYNEFTNAVLNRVLELSAEEFELLVTQLLSAIGFEAKHLGRVGDGGVDAHGFLDIYGMAKVDLYVQAKRYQLNGGISPSIIKDLRASVPEKSQACLITTTINIPKKTREECIRPEFKRIGLIDGNQLVEILIEHYQDLSEELKDKLKLRLVLLPE